MTVKELNEYSNIASRASVSDGANLEHPLTIAAHAEIHGSVNIGQYTAVNSHTVLYPNVSIGKYCSIARNCEIGAAKHPTHFLSVHGFQFTHKHLPKLPGYKEIKRKKWSNGHPKTIIGNDVWIGAKSVIASGVKIGHGAIIGSGSIVTKDVEPYSIVAGVPAKILRYRFDREIIDELMALEWWDLSPIQLSGVSFDEIDIAIQEIKKIKGNTNSEIKPFQVVLLTGGAGYIGSHTAVELLNNDYEVIVLDNLSNSSIESIKRVEELANKQIAFYEGDIRDPKILEKIFTNYKIDCVVHFAGLKSVSESSRIPLDYYDVNIAGTINLCKIMEKFTVYNLVFSSSATVYGDADIMPISEAHPTQKPTNPYGYSKFMVEEILQDMSKANSNWSIALLRYFNPIGAHESGLIGEDPNEIPNNLVPYVAQVAIGKLSHLNIFGNDYPTHDGTGVRDYIHVVDLANGHLKAMEYLNGYLGTFIWNLGTGKGYSVLDVVNEYNKVAERKIPYEIKPRREGDIAICYADPKKAKSELNWEAQYNLTEMLRDSWNWQSKNPNGYK